MGTRCGFECVGVSVPSSQVWKILTFLAGVVAEVWLWSDEEEAKTLRLHRGFGVAGIQRGWCSKANARDFVWGPRTLPIEQY